MMLLSTISFFMLSTIGSDPELWGLKIFPVFFKLNNLHFHSRYIFSLLKKRFICSVIYKHHFQNNDDDDDDNIITNTKKNYSKLLSLCCYFVVVRLSPTPFEHHEY